MDKMSDKLLFKQLVRSTYFYVRLLLTGDRAVRESNDRQLLKNLGHWLGHLTLKRNKPLLSKELELKQVGRRTGGAGTLFGCDGLGGAGGENC